MEITKERNSVDKIKRNRKIQPTEVFDTYWKFAFERQNIFFKRLKGEDQPWTQDEVLNQYKFTNAYRALDRVSQFLIGNVIYGGEYSNQDLFYRIILFKLFNKIETWKLLEKELGEIRLINYDFERISEILNLSLNRKKTIYSAAYIMASPKNFGFKRKHQNHLKLLEQMISDGLPEKLSKTTSMEEGYELLLNYPSIGTFLAYQFITDINYSDLTNYSEMEFVKAGPGAVEGIDKCFSNIGSYSYEDVIKKVTDEQDYHFDRLGLDFNNLFGRRLQLIDCQNLFCEVGKYARVAHPNIMGNSKRIRIKQKFSGKESAKKESIQFLFPQKWDLNDKR